QRRIGNGEGRDLVQRRLGAVVLDHDAVEQRGVRASGAHVRQLLLERADGLLHLLLARCEHVVGHARPPCTSVPIRTPDTARMMFPCSSMLNTRIGSPLSMHSEIAVESITWRLRLSTSI